MERRPDDTDEPETPASDAVNAPPAESPTSAPTAGAAFDDLPELAPDEILKSR